MGSTNAVDNNSTPTNVTTVTSASLSVLFPKEVVRKYEIGQIIGDGNFAVVHECVNRSNRSPFALKIIDKTKCKGREFMITNEVTILRRIHHPNVIRLIEDFDYSNELYLVTEHVQVSVPCVPHVLMVVMFFISCERELYLFLLEKRV